jgi:glycosyltransferase involved in cell wall biosynthesis
MMHFCFWQNILSPHQSPFIRALAGQGHDVTVVTVATMTPDRLALGWKVPDHGTAKIIVAPNPAETQQLVESSPKEAFHLMAGARWTPLGNLALRQCLTSRRRVGILTEAPDPRGLGGPARWVKYTTEQFKRGAHYNFVLAMGEMGVRWFRSCGYPAAKVFPFAYVTEPAPLHPASGSGDKLALLYVGQFIVRKGLDLLLRAFAALPAGPVELRILGDGPEKPRLQQLALELEITDRVVWLAQTDATGVQKEMAQANVTLLPSRHDGWGAVVNESIMIGTPVICSTACGAAELIRQSWLGTVFRSGQVADLTKALQDWTERGQRSEAERERTRIWARCISGDSVAHYFAAIMSHVYAGAARPEAPWRMDNKS